MLEKQEVIIFFFFLRNKHTHKGERKEFDYTGDVLALFVTLLDQCVGIPL